MNGGDDAAVQVLERDMQVFNKENYDIIDYEEATREDIVVFNEKLPGNGKQICDVRKKGDKVEATWLVDFELLTRTHEPEVFASKDWASFLFLRPRPIPRAIQNRYEHHHFKQGVADGKPHLETAIGEIIPMSHWYGGYKCGSIYETKFGPVLNLDQLLNALDLYGV